MSKFFTDRLKNLVPYVPGEQPRDKTYIKLNTNESPFPPPENVMEAASAAAETLMLYSDPEAGLLREQMAAYYSLPKECIVMTNGSDEALNFAFIAFADEKSPLAFADITYGFYPVFAELNHIPYTEIPLKDDFSIDVNDYMGIGKTVVIANPNAPTGKYLPLSEIEKVIAANPKNIVIVDEAYIDFGGESAAQLVKKYDNLLVIGTFSKSRSMAGARLGFAFGNPELIRDMNTIRYSTNPYNVNAMTAAAGVAALQDRDYYENCCKIIAKNREDTAKELRTLGFEVPDSLTNFVFAKHSRIGGEAMNLALREKGILVRHFNRERIKDYNRITIGTEEQMRVLIAKMKEITEEYNGENC